MKLFKVTYNNLILQYSTFEKKIQTYENVIDKLQEEISKLREQNKQVYAASAMSRSCARSQMEGSQRTELIEDDYKTLYSPVPIRLPDKVEKKNAHGTDKVVIPTLNLDEMEEDTFKYTFQPPKFNFYTAEWMDIMTNGNILPEEMERLTRFPIISRLMSAVQTVVSNLNACYEVIEKLKEEVHLSHKDNNKLRKETIELTNKLMEQERRVEKLKKNELKQAGEPVVINNLSIKRINNYSKTPL